DSLLAYDAGRVAETERERGAALLAGVCQQVSRQGRCPMLVLSRKVGERVVIADGIVIQVLGVRGRRIRLGVEASPEVPVWRDELPDPREWWAGCQGVVRKPRGGVPSPRRSPSEIGRAGHD